MKKTVFLFLSIVMLVGCKQKNNIDDSITPKVEITEAKSVNVTSDLH